MVITQNKGEALKYEGQPGTFLNNHYKIHQNTAIINYQNTSFCVHC